MRARAALAAAAVALCACPAPPRVPVRAPPVVLRPAVPSPPPPSPEPAPAAPGGAAHGAPGGTTAHPAGELHEEPAIAGVVHVVKRGETLYRIARAYGIDLADLMETNGISDPRAIAVGTELFVPGATAVVQVPPAADAHAEAGAPAAPEPPAAQPRPASGSTSAAPPPPRDPPAIAARPPAGADDEPTDAGKPRLAWPLKGVLYGRFGVRGGARHDGVDIAAPEGTPVHAAAEGEVIYVGEQPGYGVVVILRHAAGLVTVYAHNAAVLVKEGARVGRGQPIAKVGQTGRTTGPHLHFEVREGTRPRNPLLYLP